MMFMAASVNCAQIRQITGYASRVSMRMGKQGYTTTDFGTMIRRLGGTSARIRSDYMAGRIRMLIRQIRSIGLTRWACKVDVPRPTRPHSNRFLQSKNGLCKLRFEIGRLHKVSMRIYNGIGGSITADRGASTDFGPLRGAGYRTVNPGQETGQTVNAPTFWRGECQKQDQVILLKGITRTMPSTILN